MEGENKEDFFFIQYLFQSLNKFRIIDDLYNESNTFPEWKMFE